ncbi:Hypothetical protein BQ3484_227 [Cedratvirus A11]|uniref:Uncharacterized protein n=1 Tax=Cedratvirus A11 TaxID=1903266 RepID=A0A1M7XUC7_9VIRU|nr:Hypothetical protein BQ3484_227 [Cedratvirus A11]SHO33295.1 Hypothetical protein BQ3484_227 [Cedratvirus A11]
MLREGTPLLSQERNILSLQVGGPPTLQGRDPLPLQASILKKYTPRQLQALLQENAKFAIIFPEEDLWKEKCVLDFGLPASFFELTGSLLSPKERYLQIRSYYLLEEDSPYERVALCKEARRRGSEYHSVSYFSHLLSAKEQERAQRVQVPYNDDQHIDLDYPEDRAYLASIGNERAFNKMIKRNDELILESAISSGRVDFVNRALSLFVHGLPKDFNLEDYVEEKIFNPHVDTIHVGRLPEQLESVLLSCDDLNQGMDDILQCAIASFNLNILDFFLALYRDGQPYMKFGMEDFVEEYRQNRNVVVAYSILQRIGSKVDEEGLIMLSETGNIDLFLLVAKKLSRRAYFINMQRIYTQCMKKQRGNLTFTKVLSLSKPN